MVAEAIAVDAAGAGELLGVSERTSDLYVIEAVGQGALAGTSAIAIALLVLYVAAGAVVGR